MHNSPTVTAPRIVLLEDDPLQAEWIEEKIRSKFKDAQLQYFDSEHSFTEGIKSGEIGQWAPQFAILDLLVRNYAPEDLAGMDEPPDFLSLKEPKEAGLRCRDLIRDAVPAIRIAIVTIMVKSIQLEGADRFFQKGADGFGDELFSFFAETPRFTNPHP